MERDWMVLVNSRYFFFENGQEQEELTAAVTIKIGILSFSFCDGAPITAGCRFSIFGALQTYNMSQNSMLENWQ